MNNRNSYSSTTAPFNNNNNGNNNQVAPRNKKTDINTNRNADTELLSQHGNYVLPHVGNKNYGDADLEYIKRQRSILDKNASKVPSSFDPPYNDMYTPVMGLIGERNTYVKPLPEKSDRYDAFGDFLYSKGLMDRDNVTRYITHYINIDSSERQTAPFAEVGWRQLQTDSLKMEKGKFEIFIKDPGHEFEIGDKIGISGIQTVKRTIKTIVNGMKKIDFTDGSQYMAIYTDSGLNLNETDAIDYDTEDLRITISGVQGFPGKTFIGNIPINTINTTQPIFLVQPETDAYDPGVFYIKLVRPFEGTYEPTMGNNITLSFNYIGGIPVNKINSEYPINLNHLQGFQIISDTTVEGYSIEIFKEPATTLLAFGGSNVYVGLVSELEAGFPDPNHYVIKLGRTYENIVKVTIRGSEFPNAEKVVRTIPSERKNNKLYWQNLDDGDNIYSIEIPPGNYTPQQLKTVLEELFKATPRVNPVSLDGDLENTTYMQSNFFDVVIDPITDIVTFKSFIQAELFQPFTEVNPPITETSPEEETYTITVEQTNHGLDAEDEVRISNAIAYYGIPASEINQIQTVTNVVDDDHWEFQVSRVNLESTRENTGGGSDVMFLVQSLFRMRFDEDDTLGKVLGFRNPGNEASIFEFGLENSNNQPYYLEPEFTDSGYKKVIKNNALVFTGDSYIIVECPQFKDVIDGQGSIKDIFTKIQLSSLPGTRLFNTFIDTPIYFHDPIPSISELEFFFYSPDGNLYDFNGLDHSFVIELTVITEIPKGTGISSKLAKIN